MPARDRFHFDSAGRLHTSAAISGAGISVYRGSELHDFDKAAGLDPRRFYRLLRDPASLRRAAVSVSGLPLLSEHVSTSMLEHPTTLICGAIGSNVRFDGDQLIAPVSVWTRGAIDDIKSRKKCQLSCGWRFALDMRPGWFLGQRYDGVMRNLTGHHVALVASARVPDCAILLNMEDTNEKRFRCLRPPPIRLRSPPRSREPRRPGPISKSIVLELNAHGRLWSRARPNWKRHRRRFPRLRNRTSLHSCIMRRPAA